MRKLGPPFVAVACLVVICLVGCAPSQSAAVNPQANVATKADLEGVRAQIVEVRQKTENNMTTLNEMRLDTQTFKNEIKGAVSTLTQTQFRFESWWATVSARLRPRVLGFGGFLPVVQTPGLNPQLGERGSSGGGSGAGDVGGPAAVPVTKGSFWWGWPGSGFWR